MKTELYSLSKIFSDYVYRIPDYQRGYSWTKNELFDFWDDLIRLDNNSNHYVGVLTLEPVSEDIFKSWNEDIWLINSKSYIPYYIVDGQQRLTTSIILIKAIVLSARNKGISLLNYTAIEEIERKFLFEKLPGTESTISFLFGYDKENPSYNYLSKYIFLDQSPFTNGGEDTIYTKNLYEAKNFFLTQLSSMDKNNLEIIYRKITQKFLFNIYQISEDIDVFITFETMNNRGKPLSQLELLKNRLIYISTLLIECPEENKKKIRQDINDCWKDIYHYLGKDISNKLNDDNFLDAHMNIYHFDESLFKEYNQKNYRSEFNKDFPSLYGSKLLLLAYFIPSAVNSKITISEISKYISSLKDSINKWYSIHNPQNSNYSQEIKEYLQKIKFVISKNGFPRFITKRQNFDLPYVLTLLTLTKESDQNKILIFLKSLERMLFISSCFNQFYFLLDMPENISIFEIFKEYKSGQIDIDELVNRIDKYTQSLTTSTNMRQFIKNYSKVGFYDSQFNIKYFMYEYELSLMKSSKVGMAKLDINEFFNSQSSIEHIYPQNARDIYWTKLYSHYPDGKKRIIKNSLGNLVAISPEKNIKLKNNAFPIKKNNGKGLGFIYGTYSEIEISQYDEWSIEEIKDRGLKLFDFLQKRWNIKITDDYNSKLEFLGLNGLLKTSKQKDPS